MLSILLGLYTAHLTPGYYNDNNQLVAAKYDNYIAGTMTNSYYRRSYLAGYDVEGGKSWGVILGAATGYDYDCLAVVCKDADRDNDDIMPIVAPYYRYGPVIGLVQGNAFTLILEIEL